MMNTIIEQITPETAAMLSVQAAAHGLSIDEYLRNLIRPVNDNKMAPAFSQLETDRETSAEESKQMDLAEIDRILDELAEGGENLPPLPSDFSREDIYFDHD
ncbi:MAG: hypothetical protein ACREEM_04420 [Blastocatellia bacterium]